MKRMAFPRFYFLSNNELLDILANARNPRAIQVVYTVLVGTEMTQMC